MLEVYDPRSPDEPRSQTNRSSCPAAGCRSPDEPRPGCVRADPAWTGPRCGSVREVVLRPLAGAAADVAGWPTRTACLACGGRECPGGASRRRGRGPCRRCPCWFADVRQPRLRVSLLPSPAARSRPRGILRVTSLGRREALVRHAPRCQLYPNSASRTSPNEKAEREAVRS